VPLEIKAKKLILMTRWRQPSFLSRLPMRVHRLFLFTIPVLAGIAVGYYTIHRNGACLGFPAVLTLDNHEIGDLVVAPFVIQNRGSEDLVINDIRTNCSCTGMELEEQGKFSRIESLRVRPGEQAKVVMRISVRGVPAGGEMRNVVYFRTNDPSQPEASITAIIPRVSAGVHTIPRAIVFGNVQIGQTVRTVADVLDTAKPPRIIQAVTTTDPDTVTARLLPVEAAAQETTSLQHETVIARVEVLVNTTKAREVDAAIEFHLEGSTRRPDTLPISGKILALVEVAPALLALPRESAEGLLYSASVLCKSNTGAPIRVIAESVPEGLELKGDDRLEKGVAVFHVTLDPNRRTELAKAGLQRIVLRATVGEKEQLLQIPVLVRD
jgi:hypothetical protein